MSPNNYDPVVHSARDGHLLALARRAVFFDKGRIAAAGPLDEILNRFHWERRHTVEGT